MVEELDEMTKAFSVNRSDIIVEAIKAYISEHKALMIYQEFENACQELEQVVADDGSNDLQSLDSLISDLESN